MSSRSQLLQSSQLTIQDDSQNSATQFLYEELNKGIQNLKNGEIYTIDEAWEEIDKIHTPDIYL